MNRRNRSMLVEGTGRLGLEIDSEGIDKLVRYCDEISLWNRKMNLVKGTERDLIVRHVLDTLAAAPMIDEFFKKHVRSVGTTLADIGSGAGFPGIPLSILFPDVSITLIERSTRRASFLTTVKLILELSNVTVVESVDDAESFTVVTCRAFQPYDSALPLLTTLCEDGGIIAYYAATPPVSDSGDEDRLGLTRHDTPLTVPFLDAPRTLVVLEKKISTM